MAPDLQALVERLVLDYAQTASGAPLAATQSLRDLGVESMALVSLVVRLGDELGVDVGALDVELGSVKTLGDLERVARSIAASKV